MRITSTILNTTCTVVFGFLFISCAAQIHRNAPAANKPNILFIAIDDLRPELGCYGKKYMVTPHIDKLAAEGAVFLNHYVTVPTCGPSRYSLLTGKFPRNRAALSNDIFEKTTAVSRGENQPESMAAFFKQKGYRTVGIGKISHSPDGKVYGYTQKVSDKMELPHSWSQFHFNPGKWTTGWNAFFGYASGENRQSLHNQVYPFEAADVADTGYPDGLTAELAIAELNKLGKNKAPFFLAVGFFKPHLPFTAPKKYWDLYDEEKIETAFHSNIPDGADKASFHNSAEFNQYKKGPERPSLSQPVSDAYARQLKHAYFAAISYVDAQVGKLLEVLEKNGLSRNTIVVLWGDHGWHLGEELVWGKHTLSEYALRSPLIIRYPPMVRSGLSTKNIVQSVDIYPTLLEMTGLQRPYPLDGLSFVKLLKKNKKSDRVAFSYFNNGITMRNNRYRITKYFRKAQPLVELYDYVADPHETKNIANQEPALVQKLLRRLEQGNTGLYNAASE